MPQKINGARASRLRQFVVGAIFLILVALSAPVTHWFRERQLFDTYEHWVPAFAIVVLGGAFLILSARRMRLFEKLSETDELSGLPNRRHFVNHLRAELSRARRYKRCVSLLVLDIDYFKSVNDEYGHLFGDLVVREFGAVLRRSLREHDFIARYGGDEYIIVCPEVGAEDALLVADRIRGKVADHTFTSGRVSCRVTLSAGIAVSRGEDAESYQSLLDRADRALYQAKEQGRNRAVLAEPFRAERIPAR